MEKIKMWEEEQSKMSLMNGQKLVEQQWEMHQLKKARVKQKQVKCQYKLGKDKDGTLSSIGSLPSIMTG
jgi:hypothetical protein